ncbi:hypothetical protein PanWU01x14_364090 [Parasponia andersonii]|uniref:Uncharacterized protein n=1 Tax=Parasponia andersonii TaxID=3476 RepID=A0A2P5A6F5_PARAD|nr:hypothetical protein PanWU01x14_364090 [Parasponia andersonii]
MIFPRILGSQTPNLKRRRRRRNLPVKVAEGKARKECVLEVFFGVYRRSNASIRHLYLLFVVTERQVERCGSRE